MNFTVGSELGWPETEADNVCTHCGRPVNNPLYVHLDIWGCILPKDSESEEGQGFWPIGRTCAKLFDPTVLATLEE